MVLVLAREKESVAARKMEMSVEWLADGMELDKGGEGISLGSWDEVIGAGSSAAPLPPGEDDTTVEEGIALGS